MNCFRDFHLPDELGVISAEPKAAVRRLREVTSWSPCSTRSLARTSFGSDGACRISDRNQFQRFVHTCVIMSSLWIINRALLGTARIRAL